jgi:hypothetical protein
LTGDYAVKKVTIVGETTEESFQQRLQRLREVKIFGGVDPNIVLLHGMARD